MFRIFVVFLITFQNFHFSCGIYPKCCDSDSVLKRTNSTYICVKNKDLRLQIVSNNTNFMQTNTTGLCVDIEKDFNLYQFTDTNKLILESESLSGDYFQKCCPLNYFYNGTTHGCVKSTEILERFFEEEFVRVGLPHCKIIVDIQINSKMHLEFSKFRKKGYYCIDRDVDFNFFARVCENDYDICNSIRCIHKCCPDGQSFINGSKCYNTHVYGLDFKNLKGNIEGYNDSFAVVHGFTPPVYSLLKNQFEYYIDLWGVFTMKEVDFTLEKRNVTRRYEVEEEIYCVEHAVKKTLNDYMVFRGFPEQVNTKFVYTRFAMAISCVFLMLTILYYCISEKKRTIFGKTLISYCFISLIAFLLLSYLAFNLRPSKKICQILAFFLFYSTLSSFTWMNIMCIDIYWTFGSSKSFSSTQYRSKELKRFILYSLYGWGFPGLLTIIIIIFYHVRVLPNSIEILVSERKCFIHRGDDNYAQFLFSTTALTAMEICNLILFIKTALYCLKVKREISKMNDTHALKGEKKQTFNKLRDRFGLLIKLFLIMGVSFLFEVVSTFYGFKKNSVMATIEVVWDTFNSLQGFFIFVIFIMKKRIFQKCMKKTGLTKLRKFSLISSATTQTVSSPQSHKNGTVKR